MFDTVDQNPRLYELIDKYKTRDSDLFFCESGSYDGITQSNTVKLEQKGWKGILIEPAPLLAYMSSLHRPNCVVENCALVSFEYPHDCIWGNFLANCPMSTVSDAPEYFDDILKGEYETKRKNSQMRVNARTLQSILDQHKVDHVDFFSLDVEGYELEVLKGIDFTKTRIDMFLIETANRPWYQDLVRQFMNDKGYIFVEPVSGNDDFFRLK